jgi:Fe-Mn family superoxide dismutase
MAYETRNYEQLLGIDGLSDQILKNHFTLYQGYVTNTNKLADALGQMLKEGKIAVAEYAELKRRFGWEFNGMRLHEYYFGNMVKGGKGLDLTSGFAQKLAADWGSYDNWQKDFKASGAIRGIGWVVLCLDPIANRTCNVWINEHDAGHLAGGIPLMIMDVFEHAFMIDYGLKRADYIETFFRAIDWSAVTARYANAPKVTL